MDPLDFRNARIDHAKIVDYLLRSASFAAVAKAKFFRSLGFVPEQWRELATALRDQASAAEVVKETTEWGTKIVATGNIDAPTGRPYKIVSVWIDEPSGLRLVTAYPHKDSS